MSPNPIPISVDEAAYRWVRAVRSGRQKGAWVYLDADLLRRSGIDPSREFEVMRYAQSERVTRKDGTERVRARVVLNLRMLLQQDADGGTAARNAEKAEARVREPEAIR